MELIPRRGYVNFSDDDRGNKFKEKFPIVAAHSESSSTARWLLVAVLVFAAAMMIAFRASEQTGDSLEYAQAVRSGMLLFHPHHLLFNPIVRLCWKGLAVPFPSIDPIAAGQVHNVFWALVLLACFFILIRRMTGSAVTAAVFTLVFFATIGIWRYATLVEVYIPSMACTAVVLVLLYRRPGPFPFGLQAAVVFLTALAILYNQMAIFFIVALAILWTPRFAVREIRRTIGLAAAIGALVLGSYVAAFLTTGGPKTPAGFLHWCLSYAFNPDPSWGSWKNISVVGMSKEFLSFAQNVIFVPRTILVPIAVLSGLICGMLTFFFVRSILRRKPETNFRSAMFFWLLVNALFMWWFSPGGEELSIPLLLPVLLLIARMLADAWESSPNTARIHNRILAISAFIGAVVFVINLVGAVRPAHASRGEAYGRAALLQSHSPAEAAIFTDFETAENLEYYFNRSRAINALPVLFSFYDKRELEPAMIPDASQPILASVENLQPGKKPAEIFGGEARPREWRAFIEWICGCEIRDNRVVAARIPSAVPGLSECLLLSEERRPVDGLPDLFRRLDETTAVVAPSFAGSFSAWLERHPAEAR